MLEDYPIDGDSGARTVKEIYNEAIRRYPLLSASDYEHLKRVFDRMGSQSNLKFLPDLKGAVEKRYS